MERVAFLLETTGERLGCLLNPDSLIVRRLAGVRLRQGSGGTLTGVGMSDDRLLYTGGGTTELGLDLLFDVSLSGSSVQTEDVRDLTRPLWNLAENATESSRYGRPPTMRFVWGKSWNIPAIVAGIAERFEFFTPEGTPRRSWLRMRLLRVADLQESSPGAEAPLSGIRWDSLALPSIAEDQVITQEHLGGPAPASGGEQDEASADSERLDQVAYRHYGNCAYWKLLAAYNGISNPLRLATGFLLRIPNFTRLLEGAE